MPRINRRRRIRITVTCMDGTIVSRDQIANYGHQHITYRMHKRGFQYGNENELIPWHDINYVFIEDL